MTKTSGIRPKDELKRRGGHWTATPLFPQGRGSGEDAAEEEAAALVIGYRSLVIDHLFFALPRMTFFARPTLTRSASEVGCDERLACASGWYAAMNHPGECHSRPREE